MNFRKSERIIKIIQELEILWVKNSKGSLIDLLMNLVLKYAQADNLEQAYSIEDSQIIEFLEKENSIFTDISVTKERCIEIKRILSILEECWLSYEYKGLRLYQFIRALKLKSHIDIVDDKSLLKAVVSVLRRS